MRNGKSLKLGAFVLAVLFMATAFGGCGKNQTTAPITPLEKTAKRLIEDNPAPNYGSIGGEWLIMGLARSGGSLPKDYIDGYYKNVCDYVKSVDGVLDTRKYTEYSRLILALTAINKSPSDVNGYNLLLPLGDGEQTAFQGINGVIYALLALDSGNYDVPTQQNAAVQATRQEYVDKLISAQLQNGGWSFMGDEAEVDITAMALQALAKYRDDKAVSAACEKGITLLAALQNDDGGYMAYDVESSESLAQVIVALCELGIDVEDERFVKNGNTLEKRLLAFMLEDGSFKHTLDGKPDQMPTEQAFYALVAIKRQKSGLPTLYDMADAKETLLKKGLNCTIEIRCDTILENISALKAEKKPLVPENGIILAKTECEFEYGESVFDVFRRELKNRKIHFEYVDARLYNSVYIEGIGNIYEFDCGSRSGWMYSVNGIYPGVGCSAYILRDGDEIVFSYTCDMGNDLVKGADVNVS